MKHLTTLLTFIKLNKNIKPQTKNYLQINQSDYFIEFFFSRLYPNCIIIVFFFTKDFQHIFSIFVLC